MQAKKLGRKHKTTGEIAKKQKNGLLSSDGCCMVGLIAASRTKHRRICLRRRQDENEETVKET